MLVVVDPVICRMGLWLAIMAMQQGSDVGQPQPNVGSLDIERAYSWSPSLGAVAVFHCRRRRLTSSLSGPVAEDCSTSSCRLGGEQNQKFIRHLNEKFTERLKRLDEKFAKRLKTFNYLKGTPIHLQ